MRYKKSTFYLLIYS